ncbi:polar amino acid transport system substrate-binding protein [Pseudoalteromonas denitrificans DSM 6059]|uniref:Polar amino acid transport system substrate-binding protein n=2 Tax=Pseudoalteromonas TaxID=53246 RepID=A0A1I1S9T3_9GAMM|nr:polar amino acid transport system substrate-binding protein [Pseudoalteromonas denitrificans DSM 6059]
MANHPIIALGVNHAPPYSFVEENSDSSGLIIDIMQRIGSELDFELQVVSCPFPRCLKMAKEGKLDILGGLVKTEERNQYLDFIEPAYMALNSSYVFYSLKEKNLVVNEYEQLKDKRIAVMRNAAYFELFDSDAALNKIIVSSEKVAVDMLLKDRVDLVIAVEETADYSIKFLKQASHRLQKLNYRHTDNILGYAAISRKYQNIELLNKIKQKMRQFQKSGVLTQLVKPYNLPPINKP